MSRSKKASSAAQRPVVFEYWDYKSYIEEWIQSRPQGGRGERSRIAEQVRCHLTYVSQVLNGPAHFSLEQGAALSALFEHGDDESDFFILLLEYARAGTIELKKFFEKRIRRVLDQRLILKNRFRDKKTLTREDQMLYYSDWTYCAVHMAVLVSSLRTPGEISKYLGISVSKTSRILGFLESTGLIRRESGIFIPSENRIHLESDSPMISKHHSNWRIQAIRALDRESPSELHYSSVMGISNENLPKVREVLVRAIEEVRSIVRESKDETIYCYTLDLFGLED